MKKCAVIGSINMDMVLRVPRFPLPGETLTGSSFQTVPGGKGANQAIALARLGTPVCMAGRVGEDSFGSAYLRHFQSCGVDVRAVDKISDNPTGVASIWVTDQGENCIVVARGTNENCDEAWADEVLEKIMDCDIFLLQMEIPLPTVEKCIDKLHRAGKIVILDPAPAQPLSRELLEKVDYVTPNETELRVLTSFLPQDADAESRMRALNAGNCQVIHKCGGDGAYIMEEEKIVHVPGYRVNVVDTTAAGDTFNAGFATGLAMGLDKRTSVELGNAAGALAVTALGAQQGMPSLAQAQALMKAQEEVR